MTLQQVRDIDSLIDWLDNERDGAEDAGSVARSATNWHPALVALRLELANLVRQYSDLKQFGSCEVEADFAASQKALEAERIENTRLREAVQVFEKGYNTAEADLAAARTSEKRAWDEAAQARIDGAENLMLLTHALQADLAALTERVCETCRYQRKDDSCRRLELADYDDAHFRGGRNYHDCDDMGRTCGAYAAKEPTP